MRPNISKDEKVENIVEGIEKTLWLACRPVGIPDNYKMSYDSVHDDVTSRMHRLNALFAIGTLLVHAMSDW